jgi:hypothetical protein
VPVKFDKPNTSTVLSAWLKLPVTNAGAEVEA